MKVRLKVTDIKQRSEAGRLSKRLLPFFLLFGLVLFFLFGGYRFLSFSQLAENYTSLKAFVDEQLVIALLIFGATYTLTVALSLPIASLLTITGGALLGWAGAAVVICAATIGATIVFIAARTIFNEFFINRSRGFIAKLETGFQENAFSYLLALRLIPAAPFWVVNIIPAMLGMRLNQYVLATFIGITPGTLIYVWVARGFDSLLSRGQSPDFFALSEPAVVMPLLALGLFSLIPALWRRFRARQQITTPENDHDCAYNEVNNG